MTRLPYIIKCWWYFRGYYKKDHTYKGTKQYYCNINKSLLDLFIKCDDFAKCFYLLYSHDGPSAFIKPLNLFGIEVIEGEMNNGNGS